MFLIFSSMTTKSKPATYAGDKTDKDCGCFDRFMNRVCRFFRLI